MGGCGLDSSGSGGEPVAECTSKLQRRLEISRTVEPLLASYERLRSMELDGQYPLTSQKFARITFWYQKRWSGAQCHCACAKLRWDGHTHGQTDMMTSQAYLS
jgi:hypothetical protein